MTIYLVYICYNFVYRCIFFQVENLNLATNLEIFFFGAMLIACNTRHFVKSWIVTQKVSHPTNNHRSAIFLESFDSLHGEDNYLLGLFSFT